MTEYRFRKAFLLLLVIAVSVVFVMMLQPFITTILLAAIFAGLVHPLYMRMVETLKGNRSVASALTLVLVLVVVIVPVLVVLGIVVNQAIRLTGSIGPFIDRFINEPTYLD